MIWEVDGHGRPTKLTAIPMYGFFASQAAELLSLKAALLKRGFAETDLRTHDYRHTIWELPADGA